MDHQRERTGPGSGPVLARARSTTAGAAISLFADADPPSVYWSSPHGTTLAAAGVAAEIRTEGTTWTQAVREWADEVYRGIEYQGPTPARPRILGATAFDPERSPDDVWRPFPRAWYSLPETQVTESEGNAWITRVNEGSATAGRTDRLPDGDAEERDRLPGVCGRTPVIPEDEWYGCVSRIRAGIREDTYAKVVLANGLSVTLEEPPDTAALVRQLEAMNPNCYVTVAQPAPDTSFAAATPERLVRTNGSAIHSDALAGSFPRGNSPGAEERFATELVQSGKETHEHDLVVEAIVNSLEEVGASVDVGERSIHRVHAVQHLRTPIRGTHEGLPHVLRVVDKVHPTPAVAGIPRDRAIEAIRDIESFDRGWYAAPIGWFDRAGDGEFAIGIRSAAFRGAEGRLFAGAGIVEDSDPQEEWDELQLKYRSMLDAFAEE